MKKLLAILPAGLLAVAASGQSPLFQNFGTLNFPPADPIDAVTVENFGTLDIFSSSGALFDTQNTRHFINRPSGVITADPGARFDFLQGSTRLPLTGFTNQGNIFVTEDLRVNAANLVVNNGGLLSADRGGRIRLEGGNVNLFNAKVRAADAANGFNFSEGGFFLNSATYFNPENVVDEYWGATNAGSLNQLSLNFMRLGGISPGHNVRFRGSLGTSTVFVDTRPETATTGLPGYSFYWTSSFVRINATTVRAAVQMVFVQTNLLDNPNVRVYFPGGTNSNNFILTEPIVEFGIDDFDIISGQTFSRHFFFVDQSAIRARPNVNNLVAPRLFQNQVRPGHFRSEWHQLARTDSPFFPGFEASPTIWDPDLVFTGSGTFNGRYQTNQVSHESSGTRFTILPRDVGAATITSVAGATGLSDPTNSPGRVEILADQLNLRFSRMRAENLISIKATNITDLTGFRANAQNVNIELLSPEGTVAISNAFPTAVSRLNGTVSAWSGVWQVDQFITNQPPVTYDPNTSFINWISSNTVQYTYHVLVLNNSLSTNQPVGFENFRVGSSNLVLHDAVTVNKSFHFGGDRLHLPTNGSITLGGTNQDLTAANLPRLNYFTNQGAISVPRLANFGLDRATPYSNIVNEGTMTAGSLFFSSREFQNTGSLLSFSGPIFIDATTNRLYGGLLFAPSNIRLTGGDLSVSNAVLSTSGSLVMDVRERLSDMNITNDWNVADGFSLLSKPAKGDLLASSITSFASEGSDVLHFWGAEDRGDNPSGYLNNAALGRLVLDGEINTRFVFSGTDAQNALYVDTLELRDYATNYASSIIVDPNLTIYFAESNVPEEKLTNAFGGRFVWVSESTRAGPNVQVQLSMTQTTNMTMRAFQALLPELDDYDGDGVPNYLDPTPMSGFMVTDIRVLNLPGPTTVISWQGLGGTTYFLEYKSNLNAGWSPLQTITPAETGTVTALDPVPFGGGQRYYRVRYSRP